MSISALFDKVREKFPDKGRLLGFSFMWLLCFFGSILSQEAHAQKSFDENIFFKNSRKKIKVGIKIEPPFIMKDADGTYYGLSIDLWEYVAKRIEVDYEYKEYRSIQGILHELVRQQLDITIAPLTVSEVRLASFEVTQPFFISSLGAAVSSHGDGILGNLFSWKIIKILASLVLVIVSIGTAMWFIERRRNAIEFAEDPRNGWIDGVWWAAVTMTTVGYGDKIPKTRSGKLLALVWMFTSIILISSLTASITSQLYRNQNSLEIKHVDDLMDVKDKIGTVGHSNSFDYLRKHNIGVNQRFLYESPLEGLKALQRGEIKVFVYDKAIMYHMLVEHGLKEDIQIMPATLTRNYRSFMMPRNSPLIKDINPEILAKIQISSWISTLRKYNLEESTGD